MVSKQQVNQQAADALPRIKARNHFYGEVTEQLESEQDGDLWSEYSEDVAHLLGRIGQRQGR